MTRRRLALFGVGLGVILVILGLVVGLYAFVQVFVTGMSAAYLYEACHGDVRCVADGRAAERAADSWVCAAVLVEWVGWTALLGSAAAWWRTGRT
jgi:hypothetical protein